MISVLKPQGYALWFCNLIIKRNHPFTNLSCNGTISMVLYLPGIHSDRGYGIIPYRRKINGRLLWTGNPKGRIVIGHH